jgi:hypothetical protein
MAVFCVVISGRLPGDKDDVSVWAPVKAAFKLDDESFTQRVLTAMPLIVRQGLDEPSADKLTYQLRANGVDASKQPDASPMAFIERGGTTRGPVPLAVLGLFIHPNERYRIDGDQTWQTWFLLEPAFELSLPTSIEDVRFKGIDGEEVPPPLPTDSMPSSTAKRRQLGWPNCRIQTNRRPRCHPIMIQNFHLSLVYRLHLQFRRRYRSPKVCLRLHSIPLSLRTNLHALDAHRLKGLTPDGG